MSKKRLFHNVADQIAELIDQGVFPPGTNLPGERDLAERFEVSRVTVREAEIALQAIGRIEIKSGSGVYVCEEQPQNPGKLPEVSAFEVTEARSLIEAENAALAAKVISDENLKRLDDLIETMANSDNAISLAADKEFHATIARSSGNGAMVYAIEALWRMREEVPEVRYSYEAICDDNADARAKEHLDILNALKARNPAAARRAMREHFLRLIGSMLEVSEQEALREVQKRAMESRERFLGIGQAIS
jgi:DNA-binding FadR family transcriptional regulator